MAKKRTDINTKSLIYNNAKFLFFQKGYTNTTYDEICEKIGLNKAMLKYHFSSKKNLAALIYNEIHTDINEYIEKHMGISSSDKIRHFILQTIFFDLIKNNSNFNLFYIDICKDNILTQYTKGTTCYYIAEISEINNMSYSESDLKVFSSIFLATQSELLIDYFKQNIDKEYEELEKIYFKLLFGYFGYSDSDVEYYLDKSRAILENYDIDIEDSFQVRITKKDYI